MSKLIETLSDGMKMFYCPGCKCSHLIDPKKWNIDEDNNTISPSILVRGVKNAENDPTPTVCHSFVRNGMIQYLNDCTHSLNGKTVPMEPV